MITRILIRDFAIIEEVDIDLTSGFSVITGETGAGKSIIIEAVSLALGSRADSAMVRAGKQKAFIQIVAEIQEDDGVREVILTREVSASGKSAAKIDGEIVSVAQLSAFSARLADIHGQYDHQSLLKTENHIALVDSYHSLVTAPLKEQTAGEWKLYSSLKAQLTSLLADEAAARRRLDFMRFELDEITNANPRPEEDAALRERLAILQNSGFIFEKLSEAAELLYDGAPSAEELLGKAMRAMQNISAYSEELSSAARSISDSYYIIEDLASSIRANMGKMEFSPEELNDTISRLDLLERLCAKYGGSIPKMLEYRQKLLTDLENIENIDSLKEDLSSRLNHAEEKLIDLSARLTAARKEAAAELEVKINAELASLNFSNASFAVSFTETADIRSRLSGNGVDNVEFLISSNRGQPLLPLTKVASGGEMSRMMLAFKSVTGSYDQIPTMIFDEIDSGISGVTASIVGEKLAGMARHRQIVCITHLPQIAAFGHNHFMIQKNSDDEKTFTVITALKDSERVQEIARLLGGANITETTLKSARELIDISSRRLS
ncbi:MAG: DNA repair protein RecN [Clostridiales Family XIII bacterium]|nr:DNA repair protein RecN [Clostridiales Family XIII bacterium]